MSDLTEYGRLLSNPAHPGNAELQLGIKRGCCVEAGISELFSQVVVIRDINQLSNPAKDGRMLSGRHRDVSTG